jgi:predicted  nucleic acid-binding Zn-ribbon protein
MCMMHGMNHASDDHEHDDLKHEVELLKLRVEKLESEINLLKRLIEVQGEEKHVH